ncbi:MAG: TIGR00153 family protein [SAR86 cluster bacterium]|nr:TIGR00153 family protein [SAR86 cluster bacterium]
MNNKRNLSELISKSPFGPIQVHMEKTKQCADELLVYLDAAASNDWDKAKLSRQRIIQLEKEADELKAETRDLLPKGMFLFVPRGDLLDLIGLADEIPNTIKDVSGLMYGRKMIIPSQISTSFKGFAKEAVSSVTTASVAIDKLAEVSRLAFGSKASTELDKIISGLDSKEREIDQLEVVVRKQLFDIEKDLPPVDVIFLYDIINKIGELADRAEQLGHRLTLIAVR